MRESVNEKMRSLQLSISQEEESVQLNSHSLCTFLPTEDDTVTLLLSMLKLHSGSVFYDLGCGDGRIVISVVKHFQCRGIGIELSSGLVEQARARSQSVFSGRPDLLDRVSFLVADIAHVKMDDADAVFIYMPSSAVHELIEKVLPHVGLKQGTLIYMAEHFLQSAAANKLCKRVSSDWTDLGIHCYSWRGILKPGS